MSERCGSCGQDPAEGFAMIGDTRYCHGDNTHPAPTCYMLEQWAAKPLRDFLRMDDPL